jgi:competence protein ComEC
MNRLKWLVILVTWCALVSGFRPAYGQPSPGTLIVHFIDVGDGNSTLLVGPDFTILIDTGRSDGNEVVPYLRSVGVHSLDLLVGTHPHSDHIGQFPEVLSAFPVHEVWMSGIAATSVYEQAFHAILLSQAIFREPLAGEIHTIGSTTIEVLNPTSFSGDPHRDCIVMRLIFGEVAFMFPGDAEMETELAILNQGRDLRSQVLQLGHHGSSTSTSLEFLEAVQPEVAIYSAGLGNPSGNPSSNVLSRLDGLGIAVYGTDLHSTIRVITDGRTFHVELRWGEIAYSSAPIQATASPTATLAATGGQ